MKERETTKPIIVPDLKPTRVHSIYQGEISKIVRISYFPNWYNKKKSKGINFYELVIPNSVKRIREDHFRNNKSFDWLIVGNGLNEIPARAFQNIAAEYVYMSNSVQRIGDYAFAGSDVKYVIIPNNINLVISDTAFFKCKNIKLFF